MNAALLLSLTIGLPWLGALVVWLVGERNRRLLNTLAVVFSVAAGIAALLLIPKAGSGPVLTFPLGGAFGNFTFVPDGLGVFLAAIATVIGSLAVIFSIDYMKEEQQLGRYYAFVLFFIGAMAGLVLTSNLLLVFGFWEITALCSYALISFHNDDPKAVAGGIKALIITQLGGIGLLIGALLIYSANGSFDLNVFLADAGTGRIPAGLLAAAGFGFLAAAAAKSAQFPFQTWLPDAMEAPTPISALIHAATMVNAGVYLLARFYPAFKDVPGWTTAVVAVGAITALMAAVMALVANDLKRVLAYSTVSQLGYMVYAIGAGGVFSSQFHLLSHAIFKALLFLGAGAVIHAAGTRDMRKMGALGKQMPLTRAVFVIGALALAGIPPLNGFWSKELVLETGLVHGPLLGYIIMVLVAGLTALYTLRCVWMVFYAPPAETLHVHDAGAAMKVALVPLAAGTLVSFLLAGLLEHLLAVNPPDFHPIQQADSLAGWLAATWPILEEVLTPATLIALGAVALGAALWLLRARLDGLKRALRGLAAAAADSFGFEAINRGVVKATQNSAEAMRATQTGLLTWNVAGILLALVVILAVLAIGA